MYFWEAQCCIHSTGQVLAQRRSSGGMSARSGVPIRKLPMPNAPINS